MAKASAITDAIAHAAGGEQDDIEGLIFDEDSKQRLLERKQLHRLLALNTWLFGEEYNLTVDDQSLETVLTKHLALLSRSPLGAVGRTGLVRCFAPVLGCARGRFDR